MKTQTKSISVEKSNGRFYTPPFIVKNILNLSGYAGDAVAERHVIDNSCGDGAFLTEIVLRYVQARRKQGVGVDEIRYELESYIHGIEINETECQKCRANVSRAAEGVGVSGVNWDIVCGDALTMDRYNGKMDFVIGNPPYIRVHHLGDALEEMKAFSFAQNGMTDLFIVFYEIGLRMLSPTGVLGYITPSSFFNSIAGERMRKHFVENKCLRKVVDLKHFQAFSATTYTTIVILQKRGASETVSYYLYDEEKREPRFFNKLSAKDFYLANCFFFASKERLHMLKKVFCNDRRCGIAVKNGYATLCDEVFIRDAFQFDSELILPVVKASKGVWKKMLYPYDQRADLIREEELQEDRSAYEYLLSKKEKLLKRSNERDSEKYWYAFGRSQGLLDTYRDKLAVNSLLRDSGDLKFTAAPAGTGVYGGLYITSDSVGFDRIREAICSEEFVFYVSLLGKYKSGGYYTFSSRDLKAYLDYKFA